MPTQSCGEAAVGDRRFWAAGGSGSLDRRRACPTGLRPHTDRAGWKDLPHLVAALEQDCAYLTTYNVDDYEPGHPEIEVFRPGGLVRRVRKRLSSLRS